MLIVGKVDLALIVRLGLILQFNSANCLIRVLFFCFKSLFRYQGIPLRICIYYTLNTTGLVKNGNIYILAKILSQITQQLLY